jgi:4-amino-4-deoxy-L-arabinose transferase-like glycosyltransferase
VLRKYAAVVFFCAFAAILFAIHLAYLKLPYHWDELGQFVPTALDLYREGAWVAHSTLPNVHPPGVAAMLALVWKIFGYSIPAARLTMLAIASVGVTFTFLLAIRLSRSAPGAPAFAAAGLLMVAPMFFMQSILVHLDMPAMTLTAIALWLFLEGHLFACVAACTALVLVKETGITTPLVFGAWLWFHEKRRRDALYFLLPAAALGVWLVALHHVTGSWTGNTGFARYNVLESLHPLHVLQSLAVRLYFLFIADGHWIGTLLLVIGWRALRGTVWTVALLVALAQFALVTLLGGAFLERYLFPILPIFYAAVATAASTLRPVWRRTSLAAMAIAMLIGWMVNPPYPFHLENNLAAVDFASLQQDVAQYLEGTSPDLRIASAWPFTAAVTHPEYGYVNRPLRAVELPGFELTDIATVKRSDYDLVVIFPETSSGEGTLLDFPPLNWIRRVVPFRPPPNDAQLRAGVGLHPVMTVSRRGLWIKIYAPSQ